MPRAHGPFRRASAWIRGVAVLAGAALALAGCTALFPPSPAHTTPPTSATPLAPALDADATVPPGDGAAASGVPDGLAAAGAFTSPDGSTSGTFEVIAEGGTGRVLLSDIVSTHPQLEVRLSFEPRGDDPCADGAAIAYPSFAPGTDPGPIDLPPDLGDWSFIDEIDLIVNAGGRDDAGCYYRIVAQAPLSWTFGPSRPDLDTLTDAGAGQGALGSVAVDASGRPLSYTVAPNDTHSGVAARFGITVDDLVYLNPMAMPAVTDDVLYVDQRLNLDVRSR